MRESTGWQQDSQRLLDTLIRAGLVAALVALCYQVFNPFMSIMLWAMILAVTLYPLQQRLAGYLGGREGIAATLLVLLSVMVLMLPAWLLGDSLVASIKVALAAVRSGAWVVPEPLSSVRDWPLVGDSLYALWARAHSDLGGLLEQVLPKLQGYALAGLSHAAGAGMALLVFVGALLVAGVVMAHGRRSATSSVRVLIRLSGDHGPSLARLSVSTIRAVALGVVGIAFIQMLLIGGGFVVKGIPGAGLLALGVLVLGIMQLPALLIIAPVLIYVFATEGITLGAVVFSVYTLLAGLADNVLKPLFLGRGVAVPMPVVLLGALGGMVSGGIIGLFIGPVLLGLGYQLFWHWVDREVPQDIAPLLAAESAPSAQEPDKGLV